MPNSITITGRLTRDAEVKPTKKGEMMVFSLADDVGKDKTIFHDCITFEEGLCSSFAKYLTKGKPIFISGRLEDDSYDKGGVKIKKNRVVVNNIDFVSSGKKEDSSVAGDNKTVAKKDIPF